MVQRIHSLGRLADLAPGMMRAVEVEGEDILLIRRGDEVTAIGAICPHAGAPLAEGVLADGVVICPWHKASFCVRTGKSIAPPAVDDLAVYPVEIRNGEIVQAGDGQFAADGPKQPDQRRFVIIGAGAAGSVAAQELRAQDFGGEVVMVSAEDELPYDRTVMSKYVLSGQQGGEKSPLQDEDFYRRRNIQRRTAELVRLDHAQQMLTFADGGTLHYDAALIATGGQVVKPEFPGAALQNIFLLRSKADAERIVEAAKSARNVVVIGASFIGMEVAAALRERGLEVSVVAGESAPFERQLGPVIGNVYRGIHEEKGVVFHFNTQVERLEGEMLVRAVKLADGRQLPADLVIIGFGVKPATGFIQGLSREPDHALVVDQFMRCSDNLYAAGDIAAFPSHGDGELIRVEHWRVAQQQGRVAARNMLGVQEPFIAVPYFWTIQYMIRLDYVGHAKGDDEQVIRGNLEERNFIAYYLQDGKVAAAAGVNKDQDMAALIALMERRQDWTVDELHPASSSPLATLSALDAA